MKILSNLKKYFGKKEDDNISKHHYETLAPTGDSDSKETINMLSDFLKDEQNINVALSGKYGAGKTSVINTLLKHDNKRLYKTLHISLGMFGINKDEEIAGKDSNIFCQEIEKSIIQQIIYREKSQDLPDSNIKRITKLSKRSVSLMIGVLIIALIIYLISIYGVNVGEQIKSIISTIIEMHKGNVEVVKVIIFDTLVGIMVLGNLMLLGIALTLLLRKIIIKSYKIKLPNTEIEINEKSDESLINKYMDELVYFFSKTNYNLLIIEDLDRFIENVNIKPRILIIFQKLKELSKILNSSKQINRPIKFLYAVKDDLFVNANERTKFFDAIVPVIPVISNFNSYAELKKRFKGEKIPDKMLQDISAYINDFRLIKNISNEYYLYKSELTKNKDNSGILDEKIFSIVSLKNIKPDKYEKLQDDEGVIYKIIKNKDKLYNAITEQDENEIDKNNSKIKELQKEKIESLQELKRIAIGGLYGKNGRTSAGNTITMDQFLQNNINLDYIRNNTFYIQSSNGYAFSEQEIYQFFDGKENFIKRAERIEAINLKEIDKLKNINKQLEKEIQRIKEKSLRDIFEQLTKEQVKEVLQGDNSDSFEIDEFTLMLVSNGYIDENYKNYMFYFKSTEELKEHDYTYIINVRQSIKMEYDYKIYNPKIVIDQLDVGYFGKKEILNFYILEELLQNNKLDKNEEKINRLLELLLEINDNTQKFALGFLKFTKNQFIFLKNICELNNEYLKEAIIYNIEDETKVNNIDYLIKELLKYPQLLKNNSANDYIKEYIEEKQDIENWIELNEKVKESLILLNIKFKYFNNINKEDLISFIYDNKLYVLSDYMLKILFKYKGFSEQDFEEKNLSLIMHNEKLKTLKEYVLEEKEEYINNCYLKTVGKQNDIMDIIKCLNEWKLSEDISKNIISNIVGKIKDIREVNSEYYEEMMNKNKIEPSWENYYYFYCHEDYSITDELIHNMELNIQELKKQKANLVVFEGEENNKYNSFQEELFMNDKINIQVYKQIVSVCDVIIENLEEGKIEDNKLKILVEQQKIEFNDNNLQVIYNQIPHMMDLFINNNIDLFVDEIENYTINEEMICDIVKSQFIKLRDKTKIINSIDSSYINQESMEYIINNYSPNRISKINEELKQKMFSSTLNINYKLTLLDKELEKNQPEDIIDNYIKLLPENYKYIADYESKPKAFSIAKTKIAERVIEKLENKGFKFSKKVTKNSIVISNKK